MKNVSFGVIFTHEDKNAAGYHPGPIKPSEASTIKFTMSNVRRRTELSRWLWIASVGAYLAPYVIVFTM